MARAKRKKPLTANWLSFLKAVVPSVGDSGREWARKLAFLMALLIFLGSGYYLVDDLLIEPRHAANVLEELRELHIAETENAEAEEEDSTVVYPEGIDDSFRAIYRRNPEVRGWLRFSTTGNDLFDGAIDNPVVQTKDNKFYLNHDFLQNQDKAGALYFDYRNDLNPNSPDENWLIYGHNLNSGLMFSGFNLLAKGNVNYAKRLTTLTLDTLWGEHFTYKVFAVMILNADATEGPVFNYLRTEMNEVQFNSFVEGVRARSLFDFGDVDVQAGDRLLTLSTCSNKRDTTLKNGRTVIVARRLRDGESPKVDVSKTTVNDDVLMPKAWYVNKKKEIPAVYR